MRKRIVFPFLLACFQLISTAVIGQSRTAFDIGNYNLVWNSMSKNSGESMPCGGGDIGLNVWVENGDLLMYVSRSGAFDENNVFPKLGRLRVHFSPGIFNSAHFRQELKLKEGYIQLSGESGGQKAIVNVWVDVFNPIVHIEVKSMSPLRAIASYESWRVNNRVLSPVENNSSSYKFSPNLAVATFKDSISFSGNDVLFFHRNMDDSSAFDRTVHEQGLDSLKEKLWNPLHNLTFGGVLQGNGMLAEGSDSGTYANTPFRAWHLRTTKPQKDISLSLYLHIDTSRTISVWKDSLNNRIAKSSASKEKAWEKTQQWWQQFWERSYIGINLNNQDTSAAAWQVGRNYQLFRYMLGCNADGSYPTKFNGGLFTYDPVYVDPKLPFSPDFRQWGGGTFTAQNQRLVYWNMLKSGDEDMMRAQFDFYLNMLRNVERMTAAFWKHDGACFNEQIENFGLAQFSEYHTDRPAGFEKGLLFNDFIDYTWDTILEFCLMILDAHEYSGEDISRYLPLIESSLTFFDQHYQQLQSSRSTKPLDEQGHLVIYPGSACETYKVTWNSVTTVAGLSAVLEHLLLLPDNVLSPDKKRHWKEMQQRIPPFAYRIMQGHVTLAPAVVWDRINNEEIPQLYPVFPYGQFGIGKAGLDTAINTWKYDTEAAKNKNFIGWKQDGIWCARLGLTKEAADITLKKLRNSGRRFPAFWGPGFDWAPDHNWGGSGMIGLQEMLLQESSEKLYLFPAWPPEWDVEFKLHAAHNTVIEGSMKQGKITRLEIYPKVRKKDLVIPDGFVLVKAG